MRGWLSKVVLGAVAVLGTTAQAQNLSPEYFDAIIKASVQFVCFDAAGKGLWQGSGSFIGREGIILTNNHVVINEANNQLCPVLRISMMKNEDQAPEPRYIGRVIARLPNVDLAIVQVSTDLRGNPVPSGTRFPAVPLGDSNAVRIGERIFNFGFPDINGTSETITVSSGSVNGFLENRNLMKHDALSGPGGSGGGIYNLRGELIAVHSAGVSGNNNTRQPLGRPLVLGIPMIQQNVRGFGEPWTTQLGTGFSAPIVTPVNPNPTSTVQPPPLPGNPQPIQPVTNNPVGAPNFPPKPSETWTVALDGLAPWMLNFTKIDEDGDPTGFATQSGNRTETWAFQTPDKKFRFQMVAADRSGSYFCDFDRLQVSGNAFIGGRSGRSVRNASGNGNDFIDLKTSCVAAFGSSIQLAGTTQPIQPPTLPTSLIASFPPKSGQTWSVNIDGLAPWVVSFTKLDSDGDPTGSSVQSGVTFTTFAFTDGGNPNFQIANNEGIYFCVFPANVVGNGAVLSGGQAQFSLRGNNQPRQNLNKSCTATITADSNAQTGVTPPALPMAQASLPPKPNQAWTLIIDGLAPWTLNFTKLDSDGDPTGTGVQNGTSKPVFGYLLQSGTYRFQVFDARNAIYVCDFPRNPTINGATISGGAAGTAPNPDTNLTPLNKSCSVTLNSVALTTPSAIDLLFKR